MLGKWVPDIRYESVRYLSPEAASNFISRGYELQSVDSGTPESSSKPYSSSVIKRQQLLTGQVGRKRVIPDRRRTRITDQNPNARPQTAQYTNSRRIIA